MCRHQARKNSWRWGGRWRLTTTTKPPLKAECSEQKDFRSPWMGWCLAVGRTRQSCEGTAPGPGSPNTAPTLLRAWTPRLCALGRRFFCTRNSQKCIKISSMVLRSVNVPTVWLVDPLGHGQLLGPHLLAHCAHTGARAAGQAAGQVLGCL